MEKNVYKVWANCCRAVKPIENVTHKLNEELGKVIEDENNIFFDSLHCHFDTDEQVTAVNDKVNEALYDFFEENGFIETGDYMLVVSEEQPMVRPNNCGHTSSLIDIDVEKIIKETAPNEQEMMEMEMER